MKADFERLRLLVQRSGTIPALPETASAIIRMIDQDEPSARELERLISRDSGLTAEILRMSSSGEHGLRHSGCTSIRSAILRLGMRAVRNMASATLVRQSFKLLSLPPKFDLVRFGRHSLACAFLSRYVFSRLQKIRPFQSELAADEVFACGLLGDIGIGILAHVSVGDYSRIEKFAERNGLTLSEAFEKLYSTPIDHLTAEALTVWKLDPLFVNIIKMMSTPWEAEDEYETTCCLSYARSVLPALGFGYESWKCESWAPPEVDAEIGIDRAELETVRELLQPRIDEYLDSVGLRIAA